jgi:acetolactate synthase-1/2/3 large subunit
MDAAREAGASTLFTLSGAHIFPLYDAAVGGKETVQQAASPREAQRGGPVHLIDVRHEQTAVFAAEATGKLTRTAGIAALTAGPGVTNGVSAIAGAWFNGSPLVVLGGRAPDYRWGAGALQELDHPPILESITKASWTVHDSAQIHADVSRAFRLANAAHRGPVFVDIPMDVLFTPSVATPGGERGQNHGDVNTEAIEAAARVIAGAHHPVIVMGSDTWQAGAVEQVRALIHELRIPAIANGMGRGILPPSNPLLVTRARSAAFKGADVVMVIGTPLDFRLNYGDFKDAQVVHVVDDVSQVAGHLQATSVAGELPATLEALTHAVVSHGGQRRSEWQAWAATLAEQTARAREGDAEVFSSSAEPIHPAAIYGELIPRLTDDTVVIGDGGDFVSFAGKFIEPAQPGRWLDPGPYGCLGTGPGYAMAAKLVHPQSPVVLLAGDGALGFSFMDLQSLVTHRLPVVIVVGNNSGWALERHPMRMLYGYDVIADLPTTDYAELMIDLGGGGETVTSSTDIGPALDRAFAAGIPYLVDIRTDPAIAYPRSTTGI